MEVRPSEIELALEKVLNGEIEIKEKIIIEVRVIRNGKKVFVCPFLNDAVVSKGVLSRMVELTVCLDREILSQYRSDGLIVSTPTGSTAYSLAAGGPILTQDLEAMIITPICPHILGVRPVVTVVSKELRIVLEAGEEDTTLTIDGQENYYLKIGDIMLFKKMEEGIRVYDLGQKQFFSILREKLGWHI
jgi:NAD+ kinase